MSELPLHFFSILRSSEPFVDAQLSRLKALSCQWHWHVVDPGASSDAGPGTKHATELDHFSGRDPEHITIYRAPDGRWPGGEPQMIGAPLENIPNDALLWRLEPDELWTTSQVERLRTLFLRDPERNAAIFYCHEFVGPDRVIDRRHRFAELHYRRVWRFRSGMRWLAQEPPALIFPTPGQPQPHLDVASIRPFWPCETAAEGLVFQRFEFMTLPQVKLAEAQYDCPGLTERWRALNARQDFPVPMKEYLPWPRLHPDSVVDRASSAGIKPLAQAPAGEWVFASDAEVTVAAPSRGVLYIKWGGAVDELLKRSMVSLQALHPELAVQVKELPGDATLLDKADMFAFTPFAETLYLDLDTIVLDKLDYGFSMARQHGLACAICEHPWGRRYRGLGGDIVEYNTGVLFFTERARPVFDYWSANVRKIDSSIRFLNREKGLLFALCNDQAAFALAVADWGRAPYVLPHNWNFRPRWHGTWFGPIKIWHDYEPVPPSLVSWTRSQSQPGAILDFGQRR